MNNRILSLAVILICISSHAQTFGIPECVHYEKTSLIFPTDREDQNRFYAKLDSLISGQKDNISIWHVGGSHVQGGFFSYRLMEHFQNLAGKGERGIVFPRELANTHPDSRYTITTEGCWEAPMLTKIPDEPQMRYGITGFSARTTDTCSRVCMNVDPDKTGDWHFRKLRILGYGSSEKAYPQIVQDSSVISHSFDTLTSSYLFELPEITDSITIDFIVPEGESFVLTGIQPVTEGKGVRFFASGVNGAKTTTWCEKCEDLERDLHLVRPDLVIFGLGINDSACDSTMFSAEKFKNNYRNLITKVRNVSPDCAIIFITNNDSYRYRNGKLVYNDNLDEVRIAMVELAMEYGAGVWDLYGIMGGGRSVYTWRDEGLVGKDRLHFTPTGYRLLGDLLYEAIINDRNNTRR